MFCFSLYLSEFHFSISWNIVIFASNSPHFPSNTSPYYLHVFIIVADNLLSSGIAAHVCMMSAQLPDYWKSYQLPHSQNQILSLKITNCQSSSVSYGTWSHLAHVWQSLVGLILCGFCPGTAALSSWLW